MESPQEQQLHELVAVAPADIEDTWNALPPQYGVQ